MSELDYVYVCMIAAPPEKVWQALTTAEFTEQYWHRTRVRSDFEPGSKIVFLVDGDEVGCEGEILTVEFPRELSYTWHFPRNPATRDEKPSRVTFLLDRLENGTKLTVRHDRFEPGSRMRELISGGWPEVVGGLKTLLETGSAVDFTARKEAT